MSEILNAETEVQFQGISCGICDGHCSLIKLVGHIEYSLL